VNTHKSSETSKIETLRISVRKLQQNVLRSFIFVLTLFRAAIGRTFTADTRVQCQVCPCRNCGKVTLWSQGIEYILRKIKMRKANWVGHILRTNCVLNHVIDGKKQGRIEVTGRRGRRHKQLVDVLEERRGCRKLKKEALDLTIWELALEGAMDL